MGKKYKVQGKVVLWTGGQGAWHFVHVERKLSAELREKYGGRNAWSSIRVTVKTGKTNWGTSIFWDKRSGTYLLPLKFAVRRAEGLAAGDTVTFILNI